jgi:DNA-binding CsgD family transcriptional regulator
VELLERGRYLDELDACRPGTVVLVGGEPGVGKTVLVRAFCERLSGLVLWGACDALRTPRPLGPLRDMARQAGGALSAVMAADSQRHVMFGALLDQLAVHETVAVVEDAHWADEATVDMLVYLSRRIGTTRSRLIVTYRDDEVGVGHPLRDLLGALATDRSVKRIILPPLSRDAVAAMAGPEGPDPDVLFGRTGGNPFFVTEVLADPEQPVPATVRDAVLARAWALDPAALAALQAVAIFPGYAPLSLVQAEPEALDRCVAAGMLVHEDLRIRFRHELARLALAESIPHARKVSLHRKALAGLRSRRAEPAQLAYHAEEAADGEAVLMHALAAATRATTVGAHRQAADHYAQALRFADALSLRQRAELLERYAETCDRIEADDIAITASQEAVECWREAGDQEREAALLARRSQYLWIAGGTANAQASITQALELAERLPPGRALAAAYAWSAAQLMLAHRFREAIAIGNRGTALAEQLGEPALKARALNAVGASQWFCQPEEAEPTLLRSLESARLAGDDTLVGYAMSNLGTGAGEVRRYRQAQYWLEQTISWCSARDMYGHRKYVTAWLARCRFEQGDWAAATELLDDVHSSRMQTTLVKLTTLGRIRARRGDPGAAQALDEAWALAEPAADLQYLWPVAAGRAELAWLAGEETDSRARSTYEHAVALGHGWAIGELGQWLDPQPDRLHPDAAAPYHLPPAQAAQAWEEIGCPYEAALALAQSPDHIREALMRLERLGARPAADRVARAMRDRGMRMPRHTTRVHPNGLTPREVDVFKLLQQGLRNSDIAERLHISPKTVDHHVSAILGKLGVHSRREVAGHRAEPQRGESIDGI